MVDFLVDLLLATVIIAGGIYGYKKGIVNLVLKPINSVFKLGASVFLCVPLSEMIVLPFVRDKANPIIAPVISIALTFVLVLIFGGWLISLVSGIISTIFDMGVIGKLNHFIGSLCTMGLSVGLTILFTAIFGLVRPDFSGGPLYSLLSSLNRYK